jgi:cysteine synthase
MTLAQGAGGLEARQFKGIKHIVGNTPLFAIRYSFKGKERVVYAKAEHMNLTGSIKDRMAFHVLSEAYKEGRIKPGNTIAEATSGNTGIAFSAIGRALGHSVVIFMPDWMSQERINLIKSLGATIRLVSKEEGGFLGSIRMTEELARKDPGSRTDNRSGDLVAASVQRPRSRCVHCGSRNRGNRNGGGTIPEDAQSKHSRVPIGARRITYFEHWLQGWPSSHTGDL